MGTGDRRYFEKTVRQINRFAEEEGWAIFEIFGLRYGYEIQKDDDSDKLRNDRAAHAHVVRLARAGSILHRMALEMTQDSTGD